MNTRGKYRLTLALMLVGGVLCLGWSVASLLSLFDLAESDTMPLKLFNAFGPLGVILVILGGILSRWDLRALRRQAEEE